MHFLIKLFIMINIVSIPLTLGLAPLMISQMNSIADSLMWELTDEGKQKINDLKKLYVPLFYIFPPVFTNGIILLLLFEMHIMTREKIDKKAQWIDE